jgi:hypothetical protein
MKGELVNPKKTAGRGRIDKFGKLAFIILLFPAGLYAQRIPPTDIYAGFSDFRLKDCCQHVSLWGWQAGASTYINGKLAATADFATQYKTIGSYTYKQYQFLFGPQINIVRSEGFTGFGHVLFGAMHYDCGGSPACLSHTGAMVGLGGGIDIHASSRLALRLPQIDWLPTAEGAWHDDNIRISLGVVFKMGAR